MKNAPDEEEVENFWREIYGKKVQHNGETCWIKNQYQQNSSMEWSPVCEKDIAEVLRTTQNCKAPGRDQIANFWLKQLTATHKHIAALFNRLTPNETYMGRTAPLTSKLCILYIYSTNIGTEYFKHALYSPFFLFKMQFVS